ncbi:MAG: fumarylacetoacetate hydrolase family protein [Gemmatimonadetes bacterium]|nr:fumarylacetoacetate hydrolase family protein [Gemmatimonadota bacterium]
MRIALATVALLLAAFGHEAAAQASPEPFKVGTFERAGRPFVGIVLRESHVIDFAAAHAAVRSPASTLAAPTDMKDLIARYESGVRSRIVELIRAAGDVTRSTHPSYVYDLAAVKILPPIMYPTTMLNVAVNYREHDIEMARNREVGQAAPTAGGALPGTRSAPGIWERAPNDTRWNPYMFMKTPGVIVADGANVIIPVGRTQVEWECEMGLVIGRPASRVAVANANDYIFGYTIENDMSDRGGRGDTRHGSDWVVSKNHDTFAPMGPFITPKEFVPNVGDLAITFALNGEVLQQGSTSQMIHNVFEQVSYASHIMTLRPGDVIATGTPPGVGSARTPPILLKGGDKMACTYHGVGTLSNPVVAAPQP